MDSVRARRAIQLGLTVLLLLGAGNGVVVVDGFHGSIITRPTSSFAAATRSSSSSSTDGGPSPVTALEMARGGRRDSAAEEDRPTMNEEIAAPEVRVVTAVSGGKDEALGIMTREEALRRAADMGDLDLILINDRSDPPVCKIVDYSKYRYMQEKKAKETKKNAAVSSLKEVKMSYKIDVHDYDVRKKSAARFLRSGNRVKCTVMFRGREVQHDGLGLDLLDRLAGELDDLCTAEGRPKREGRNLSLFLTPRPEVMKALSEERRRAERLKKKKREEAFLREKMATTGEEEEKAETVVAAVADRTTTSSTKAEKTLEEILGTDDYL